jgi:hypothetical protein
VSADTLVTRPVERTAASPQSALTELPLWHCGGAGHLYRRLSRRTPVPPPLVPPTDRRVFGYSDLEHRLGRRHDAVDAPQSPTHTEAGPVKLPDDFGLARIAAARVRYGSPSGQPPAGRPMDRNAAMPRSNPHETKPKALGAHDLQLFGATWLAFR